MSIVVIDVMGDTAAHYIYTYNCSWRVGLSQSSGLLLFHFFIILCWRCLEYISCWVPGLAVIPFRDLCSAPSIIMKGFVQHFTSLQSHSLQT
jgi:hypothetical protein